MAPERSPKRQKISPSEAQTPRTSVTSSSTTPSAANPISTNTENNATPIPIAASPRSSWYSRTWPRKAAPVTEVARESIASASNVAREAATVIRDQAQSAVSRKSSLALTLGNQSPSKSSPADATTTKDFAMPANSSTLRKNSKKDTSTKYSVVPDTGSQSQSIQAQSLAKDDTTGADKTEPPSTSNTDTPAPASIPPPPENVAPRSWIGWLARSDEGQVSQIEKPANSSKDDATKRKEDESKTQAKGTSVETVISPPSVDKAGTENTGNRRSWLPLWGSSTVSQPEDTPNIISENVPASGGETIPETATETIGQTTKDPVIETSLPPPQPQGTTKSSAWVFWSREKANASSTSVDRPHEGELAVSNTPSQNHPKRASIDLESKDRPKIEETPAKTKDVTGKIAQTSKVGGEEDKKGHKKNDSAASRKTTKAEGSGAAARAIEPAESTPSRTASPTPSKKTYEHLLLPSFQETLKPADNPSLLQQLARLFSYSHEPELRRLSLTKEPPKIKSALAIGVHGYFPAPVIRTVLGQPTGTSIKFADMAAKSIRRWTSARGYECQVKTAALEGEGKISERIELLWRLLLNWIDEIRKADFVLVACHSQGVPVAIMLVAKLIRFGCLNPQRVGICAMAGVNMGPFPEFKSRWISGSAGELFEFSDPSSKVSSDYAAALEEVLKAGARLTYIGSIDDQLVSLESSVYAPISHPHIFRAVSIDSRTQAPNFLSHLVGFALKLRNMGVQDHGLIRELSTPLAGSLYSGEGHSRIYEDDAVYDLAVAFALDTTPQVGTHLSKRNITSSSSNPYILPFAMRGILEEEFVKTDLQDEVSNLLKQFDEWKPTTKALKDVKFRLEGIRSRL